MRNRDGVGIVCPRRRGMGPHGETTMTYTINNIAGGDLRRFRTDADGRPSYASICHARRQLSLPGGFACSDHDIYEAIMQAIEAIEDAEVWS